MAKLARATQKIFGDNAPNTQITAFGTAMTDSPVYTRDVNTIMNNNYLSGWASAILADKSPYEEDTNGVLFAITRQLAYIYNEGIPEYDANTSYPIGAIVKSVSNNTINIYLSLVDNNAGYPLTNTTYWKLAPIGNVQPQLDNTVKLTGNQTVAGNKTFTGTTKAPTPAAGSNDTTVATTAWVRSSTAKMPNYSAGVNVNSPKSSAKYTAPSNGIYVTTLFQNNTTTTLYINNVATSYVYREGATDISPGDFTIPLSKGDVIYWNPECWAQSSKFYPYK